MRYPVGTAAGRSCTERTACGVPAIRGRGRRGVVLVIACAVGLDSACASGAGDERAERDERGDRANGATAATTRSEPGTAGARASGAGAKPICPATGSWQICSVVERLERAGLAPRREPGQVREPPLSGLGVALALGRSELRVFVYADRAARERDQSRLDATKYLPPSEPVSPKLEPTLIASENLLAILRSRNDHQRERVSDALTAGPPQSPRTKG